MGALRGTTHDLSVPFVGRRPEFEHLLAEALAPRSSSWLIVGEAGIGKSRLMDQVARAVDGSHVYDMEQMASLRGGIIDMDRRSTRFEGQVRSSGLSFSADIAANLASTPLDAPLIVLEDIDTVALGDPIAVKRTLASRPRTTVFMTARGTEMHSNWGFLSTFPQQKVKVVPLPELSKEESYDLVNAVLGERHGPLPPTVVGNPRLLLEWAAHQDGGSGLLGARRRIDTLLGPNGKPLKAGDAGYIATIASVSEVNDELISALSLDPSLIHDLSPRKFEELVAELYARSGFEVELTRASKDGGVDIYAWQYAPFGSFLTIIDCKKYRADRPVQVGLVKSLYGTVAATDASVGVIATTSYFTKGARKFQEARQHRLGFHDFVSLKEMLARMHGQPPR